MSRIVLLFIVVPTIEFALLIKLGGVVGFWPTATLVVCTGLLGGALARHQGSSVWRRLQERLRTGALPGAELLDGVIILMAGALLLTPGVLTDIVGFVGLIPATRKFLRGVVLSRLKSGTTGGFTSTMFSTGAGPSDSGSNVTEDRESWVGNARQRPQHASDRSGGVTR